jgi:hypothetical protein
MKKFFLATFPILVVLVLVLVGCEGCEEPIDPTKPDPNKKPYSSNVDFENHVTDYSILVRNNTNQRLVAFKGEPTTQTLIGGIPAGAQNHGLAKKSGMFNVTDSFALVLLTETEYNINKSNLISQKNTPFTRIYIFYNAAGENNVVYTIDGSLGGTNALRIGNPSNSLNIELRKDGPLGEPLGYAPAGSGETTLYLQDGNYNLYPVFVRYNKQRDVKEEVYPKNTSGYAWSSAASFGDFGEFSYHEHYMPMREMMQGLTMTSGTAWVVLDNQTADGVRFLEGSAIKKTLSGLENFPASRQITFQIDMSKIGNNYADSRIVSNWKFGPVNYEVSLQAGQNDTTPVTSLTIDRDKAYTITVTGNHNQGTLKAWISDERNIDVSDFYM